MKANPVLLGKLTNLWYNRYATFNIRESVLTPKWWLPG